MDGSTPPQAQANLTRSTGCTLDVVPAHMLLNDQTTPPSPLTDGSSAPTLFASASASVGTPTTDLTSLPSEVSKLSLGPAKKSTATLEEGPAVTWPYSHDIALEDIPKVAFALNTFLKSHMVEAEEYCHRKDPQMCVTRFAQRAYRYPFVVRALKVAPVLGNVCTLRWGSA